MRRFILLASALASAAVIPSACTVGDGDFDGVGGFDGFGGDEGDGDGDGDTGGGGATSGDGDGDGDFVPSFFQEPEDFPVPIEYAGEFRTAGYTSDSAELRVRDAYRLVRRALYTKFGDGGECLFPFATVGDQDNHTLNVSEPSLYQEFCKLACLVEEGTCDDADEWVCLTGLGFSDDVQSCFTQCETFTCDDGSDMAPARCDGFADCDDLSDEKGCGDFSFVCRTVPEAVGAFFVCDGSPDCSDGSDEENCGDQGFVCADGTRIPAAEQCDSTPDCADGEDEVDCESLLFDCEDGTSIPWFRMCDGISDCSNNSDEEGIIDCSGFNFDACE